jgi:opacity protein-like surface antigen
MIEARALFLGIATAAALGAAAQAADMPGTWSYERPAPRYVELSSGWYARADIAYRLNHIGQLDVANTISSKSYENTAALGVGGGYKYQWFRADVTVDYGITSQIRASSTSTTTSQPQYSAKVDTVTALANGYLDLGTWWGLTPYVGGGIGMSYLRAKEYVDTALPTPGKITSARTNLSWAAMAGLAYQINPNWIVDVGYRYLQLGDLPISRDTDPTNTVTWKQISAQEIRIGLRILLH